MDDKSQDKKGQKKSILFFSCSGAANVAEASDRAVRRLAQEGEGSMLCLAGIGAGVDSIVQQAKDSDLNVVIDGCETECAKKIFDHAGLTNYEEIRVTDLGIEKIKGIACTDQEVQKILQCIHKRLNPQWRDEIH